MLEDIQSNVFDRILTFTRRRRKVIISSGTNLV